MAMHVMNARIYSGNCLLCVVQVPFVPGGPVELARYRRRHLPGAHTMHALAHACACIESTSWGMCIELRGGVLWHVH